MRKGKGHMTRMPSGIHAPRFWFSKEGIHAYIRGEAENVESFGHFVSSSLSHKATLHSLTFHYFLSIQTPPMPLPPSSNQHLSTLRDSDTIQGGGHARWEPSTHSLLTHTAKERKQEQGFGLMKFFTYTRAQTHTHTPLRRLGFLFKKRWRPKPSLVLST